MTLNQLGVIRVEGEDAQSMLQNLLTNDVAALAINQSHLSGLCNPKGRLLALFLLLRRSDGYLLILPKAMCAGLQQRLSMYILRSKVTITDASDSMTCMGLTLATDGIINSRQLPDADYQATEQDGSILIKYPGDQSRFLCVGSPSQLTAFTAELLEQQWHMATESDWELLDIEAGLPMIQPETKEQFTTQQVNLDLVNGVSFKKGCYPGQEIVARMYYLGTPSRRMFQAEVHTANPINVGDEVTSDKGNVAGHVVRVQQKNDGSVLMLLSLKLSAVDLGIFVHNDEQVNILDSIIAE
jgi:folate-binding protein YgfZ